VAAGAAVVHAATAAPRETAVETAPTFRGNLDDALKKLFAGEGEEDGAGLTPMWPSA
jgi:hypothetical protein